ncbi:hypothetical protein GGR56DRAFT_671064 [Xylariaceae sp. FL0804]|nr:hypothetical protein GGR56DRAFT_671064 [Xylariaceae sp. FL0804]
MAIYSAVPPPPEFGGASTTTHHHQPQLHQQHPHTTVSPPSNPSNSSSGAGGVDIEAWTVSALEALSISPVAQGTTGNPLSIPLDRDEHVAAAKKPSVTIQDPHGTLAVTAPRRPPSRRDSLKRREALLKGKEGSRQRRRWENNRLVGVPNAQPPQPQDWLPCPTYRLHHVPYQVAAAWDARLRADAEAAAAAAARRKQTHTRTRGDGLVAGRVPRELSLRAKRTPAVRAWVRSLEEPVRRYLVEREVAARDETEDNDDNGDEDESSSDADTEDEEIVFVGRNGSMRDGWKRARREDARKHETRDEGMMFDALGDEDGGAFRRWITHSISDYYNLESHSVFVGDPKRKVVYVGVKEIRTGGHALPPPARLPRPLWELC